MPNSGKKITRIESTHALAEYLGLSRWTVSRALNDHPDVKPATRKRIQKAITELDFTPNPMARGLKGGKTNSIGICLQELDSSPLLARKTSLMQHTLREKGFRAPLEFTSGSNQLEVDSIRQFLAMKVDGIILLASTLSADQEIISELREMGKPIVAIDPVQELPFPTVRLDRALGMELALQHLHDLGHRRFAFLGIDRDVPYGRDRLNALRRQMRRFGLSMRHHVEQISKPQQPLYDFDYGYELAVQFLQLSRPPQGIIALNDRVAIGALKCFNENGVHVPNDYSLIGFDNQDLTRYCQPDLTTIDQAMPLIVDQAIRMLLDQVEARRENHKELDFKLAHLVSPQLCVRGSTGSVRRQRQ